MDNLLVVDMTKKTGWQIGAKGLAQLEQEIRMVLATRKGSVPLDRDYGITWDFVDNPMPSAMQLIIAEIGMQLEKYVPRIRVNDIAFTSDNPVEGLLAPVVTVEIREESMDDFIQEKVIVAGGAQ